MQFPESGAGISSKRIKKAPPSGRIQWLFQEPPARTKFLIGICKIDSHLDTKSHIYRPFLIKEYHTTLPLLRGPDMGCRKHR